MRRAWAVGSAALGVVALWILVFSLSVVRADYPEGVKANWLWYVCTTGRTATGNAWYEPVCQELPFDFETLNSVPFEGSESCPVGTCNSWSRRYVVAPVGVDSFRLSCVIEGAVVDNGFGAGTYNVVKGQNGTHLTMSGADQGSSTSGLSFYWFTHTLALGHDMGSNENDPFYSWVTNQTSTSSGRPFGSYVEIILSTTGNQVTATGGINCYVDTWTGGYEVPTLTPTPLPATSTPGPTSTPVPPLMVNTPWMTPTAFVMTPEPTPLTIGTPGAPECYVIVPEIGPIEIIPLYWIYTATLELEEFEVCTEEVEFGLNLLGFDFGVIVFSALALSAAVAIYTLFRQSG